MTFEVSKLYAVTPILDIDKNPKSISEIEILISYVISR